MIKRLAAALFAPLLAVTMPLLAPAAQAQTVQGLPDFADLADRAGPAVVNIRTTARVASGSGALPFPDIDENDPMYEFFRRPRAASSCVRAHPSATRRFLPPVA